MKYAKAIGLAVVGGAAALVGLGYLGLRATPKANILTNLKEGDYDFAPLPADLPAVVRRHYELAFGNQVPVVDTAVFAGRAQFRMGAWMNMRFTAYHLLGQNFLRDIEVTWFNIPFFRGQDSYINGHGMVEIVDDLEEGPEIDQAANVNMWCEALMFPTVADGRLRWEAIDDHQFRLTMPFNEGEDEATVSFDPVTGFLRSYSTMRYKGAGQPKTPWRVEYLNWKPYGTIRYPEKVTVMWEDEGSPWFIGTIDDVKLNIPLPEKMQTEPPSWEEALVKTAVAEPQR